MIEGSLFLECNATISGGALLFYTNDNATIHLHNSYFLKNCAYDGAIVHPLLLGRRNDLSFNVFITNVTFSESRLYSQHAEG